MSDIEMKNLLEPIIINYALAEHLTSHLPLKNISFTKNISKSVKEKQPDLLEQPGFDKKQLLSCTGYTLFFPDNTAEILILEDNISTNFFWIETLIHEITHVRDFQEYLPIMRKETFPDLQRCTPFWYWTEFHAKYKGTYYMLAYVQKLPKQYQKQYIDDLENRIQKFTIQLDCRADYRFKIYDTMHLIGEILAYNAWSIPISNDVCNALYFKLDWINDMKEFLAKHTEKISNDEIWLLSLNAQEIFKAI